MDWRVAQQSVCRSALVGLTIVTLAVTLGDPAGIGPEIVERAVAEFQKDAPACTLTLVGPRNVADPMAARLRINVAAVDNFMGPRGVASREGGQASLAALMAAIDLAQKGQAQGIVTAPISKEALAMAGSADRGHTEILARHLGNGPVAMAFASPTLNVALVTTHIPFASVPAQLTPARVLEVSQLLHNFLQERGGLAQPRLALCGLNPHAGEQGLLGSEEIEVLAPAVAEAQAKGLSLEGPFPSDTLFGRAHAGEFDGVVALYHDQGLIPVKLLSGGDAVNVTLGLKIVRTSPDHGTAFDQVGKTTIRHKGMLTALQSAYKFLPK